MSSAPRRSARLAAKAAANTPVPPQKPLTLAELLPELKTFVAEPVPEKYAQSAIDEARRLAAQNAPLVEKKDDEITVKKKDDDEISLIDSDDDITVERLYEALTKMLQKDPSSGKKIVKHVEFGFLHDTRSVKTDSKYLFFTEY